MKECTHSGMDPGKACWQCAIEYYKERVEVLQTQVNIAAGMLSTTEGWSDKHPELALKAIQDAAQEVIDKDEENRKLFGGIAVFEKVSEPDAVEAQLKCYACGSTFSRWLTTCAGEVKCPECKTTGMIKKGR